MNWRSVEVYLNMDSACLRALAFGTHDAAERRELRIIYTVCLKCFMVCGTNELVSYLFVELR